MEDIDKWSDGENSLLSLSDINSDIMGGGAGGRPGEKKVSDAETCK